MGTVENNSDIKQTRLFTIEDDTHWKERGIFADVRKGDIVAEVDVEKIYLLLDNMDPIANSKAYQTLCNLAMVEPMRVNVDDAISKPGGRINVSTKGLSRIVPYLTVSFDVMTGQNGPRVM